MACQKTIKRPPPFRSWLQSKDQSRRGQQMTQQSQQRPQWGAPGTWTWGLGPDQLGMYFKYVKCSSPLKRLKYVTKCGKSTKLADFWWLLVRFSTPITFFSSSQLPPPRDCKGLDHWLWGAAYDTAKWASIMGWFSYGSCLFNHQRWVFTGLIGMFVQETKVLAMIATIHGGAETSFRILVTPAAYKFSMRPASPQKSLERWLHGFALTYNYPLGYAHGFLSNINVTRHHECDTRQRKFPGYSVNT